MPRNKHAICSLDLSICYFRSVVLNWGHTSPGGVKKYPEGREPLRYALWNMESLINKFINKYICFYNVFNVKGLETKDNYLREAW